MYFKILKNDLKRKKSMNILLFIFIAMATTFIAGSVNNLKVLSQGTNYFFDKSNLTDYIIVSEDKENITPKLQDFLNNNFNVEDLFVDDMLSISNTNISIEGSKKEFKMKQSAFINSYNIKQQKFFDKNNNRIDNVQDGEIWFNYNIMNDNEVVEGDIINITTSDGITRQYKVAGYMKDAFLGSKLMGTVRFLLSEGDFEELYKSNSLGKFKLYSLNLINQEQFNKEYSNIGISTIYSGNKEIVKSTYLMDMVTASVFIIVSICLIIMALLILRFTIVFTVSEDIKQIGILKAIGIKDFNIRSIYLLKYLFIATIGAVVGVICSSPFGKMLLNKVLENIVTEDADISIIISIICGLLVIIVIGLFGYLCTARLKKVSPLTAIRNGNNGERFKKKSIFKLSKSKLNTSSYLAINDVLCSKKRFAVLGITFAIGVWLVAIPAITSDTLKSDKLICWFSMTESDVVLTDQNKFMNVASTSNRNEVIKLIDETKQQIEDIGYPVKDCYAETCWRFKISKEDNSSISIAYQGTGIDTSKYSYTEGKAPMLENEVAITQIIANRIDADIGDIVKITTGGEEKEYIVTALFQSLSNLGEGIRFSDKAQISYQSIVGIFGVQINFIEEYTDTELKEIYLDIQNRYSTWTAEGVSDFISNMIGGVVEQISYIKMFILCIVIFINTLIILLMQKMFLIKDTGEIAYLKSLGIKNSTIIAWITKRITFVNCIGAIIASILSVPLTYLSSGQVFKMMGASAIEFNVNILDIFIIYPAILIISGIIVTLFASLKVIKIKVKDSCEME